MTAGTNTGIYSTDNEYEVNVSGGTEVTGTITNTKNSSDTSEGGGTINIQLGAKLSEQPTSATNINVPEGVEYVKDPEGNRNVVDGEDAGRQAVTGQTNQYQFVTGAGSIVGTASNVTNSSVQLKLERINSSWLFKRRDLLAEFGLFK